MSEGLHADQARALRELPSVSRVVADPRVRASAGALRDEIIVDVVRRQISRARTAILDGEPLSVDTIIAEVLKEFSVLASSSTTVINGTGVIVQTNLGRAPVSAEAARAMSVAASRYLPLETRLDTGERGGRGDEVSALMRALTGAEQTLVVNNNAAAVLLTLTALCAGKEVVVSRGEAVEIGGGFRVPDVLLQSGAHLVEVGTTNRTYISDYEGAVTERSAAFLRVHTSNFAIVGFASSPELVDIARAAHKHDLLAIEDVGSGCLLDTKQWGLDHEPTLRESIEAGLDVVCASGDKLLGGPQAGLILGRADVIHRIARHPLARAVRADKTALAGIAATLRHYLRDEAVESIPVWWSISRELEWLTTRARRWNERIGGQGHVVQSQAVVGGGSLPGKTLPSWSLALEPTQGSVDTLARRLRLGDTAVVPRVEDGRVLIDTRTVLRDEDDALVAAISATLS